MSLELYHSNWSVCAQKVRLVLREKGVAVIEHHIDLRARAQQSPEYLALNPHGYVPTLVHDGRPVIESAIIAAYLDALFPEPPLSPADPIDRAYMQTWTRRPDDGIHRACATMANATAFRVQWLGQPKENVEKMLAATPDPIRREWRREMIEDGTASPTFRRSVWQYDALFKDMERALAERDWLAGPDYSLADIALTPYINRLAELSMQGMWEGRYSRVTDWFARVRARPNFAAVAVDYPYDDHAATMAEKGAEYWPEVVALLE